MGGFFTALAKPASTSNDSDWGCWRPAVQGKHKDAVLLLSDIDGTLTGDNDALQKLNDHWLTDQLPRGRVIVYNIARPLHDYLSGLKQEPLCLPLLRPDVLIVGEGTQVWRFGKSGKAQLDMQWEAIVKKDWNLDRVKKACTDWDDKLMDGINDSETRRFVVTVSGLDKAAAAAAALKQTLGDAYELVNQKSWKRKVRNITVLPAAAGKGNAAEFVRQSLGVEKSRSVWAGDAMGDASMLNTELQGIVVGNASAELLEKVKMHDRSNIYVASAHNAAGVQEGLCHHHLA